MSAGFPETRWTLLADLSASTQSREAALAELCRTYWIPLYAFARAKRHSKQEAEDLVQNLFFKLLANDGFDSADSEKGKLRTFLLTALVRLMANDARRSAAAKRAPGQFTLPLDTDLADSLMGEVHRQNPVSAYDRHWAEAVLREVETKLLNGFRERNQEQRFETLRPFLLRPPEEGECAQIAEQLSMSVGAVHVSVSRLRSRLRQLMREEVAETLRPGEDLEDELRYLVSSLAS